MADLGEQKRAALMAAPLDQANLAADPVAQFGQWFAQAHEAELPQPHAMSLATATPQGCVSLRLVLLRAFDEGGFLFFTGLETQKVREMRANPQVALLFPWLLLNRQVRVEGTAVALSTAQTTKFFLSRPRHSQLGAWFTQAGGMVSSRAILRAKWAALQEKFRAGEVPLPSGWGGLSGTAAARGILAGARGWPARPLCLPTARSGRMVGRTVTAVDLSLNNATNPATIAYTS